MSLSPGYTNDEIRALVYTYEQQPWGSKMTWAAEQGISVWTLRRWRSAVFDGALDQGLVPRHSGLMTPSRERRQIAQHADQQQAENDYLRARVSELEATNQALGKAIGLLHQLNEQEPDTPETSEPKNSFGQSTTLSPRSPE